MARYVEPKRALIWAAVSTRPQADEDEKFSIPQQIADAEAICRENGWQVVDVLKVPGHSRSYRTLDELAAAARTQKIDAFDRLKQHFADCDFDVFICRDANRFARKSSLLHYIVETIIEECGANIYSMADAYWVDTSNVDMWATMQGYKVRAEVKWLVEARERGLRKRAQRGITVGRRPWSHVLIKDEAGKPLRVELDASKERLFNDIYTLVVEEQVGFNDLEVLLYTRFGHVDARGKPFGNNVMYRFLYNPMTWGHLAYGYFRRKRSRPFAEWVFDDSVPVPDGIEMHRNAVPAVYTGLRAERLKAELRRRKQVMGKRHPRATSAYSGLFVCAMCGYAMTVISKADAQGVRRPVSVWCQQGYDKRHYTPVCTQKSRTPIAYIDAFLKAWLAELVATRNLSMILPDYQDIAADIAAAEQEALETATTLDNLILLQAKAPAATQSAYQKRINATAEQLEILQARLRELKTQDQLQAAQVVRSTAALDDIGPDLDVFWSRPPAVINQSLHRVMGNYRFYILEKQIIGIRPAPSRQRRKLATY